MKARSSTLTVIACAALVTGALLACKSKKPSPSSGTPTPVTDPGTSPGTPTPTPTPTFDSSKVYKVGETAKALDYAFTVENVKECKVPYYFKKKGHVRIGAQVTIESTSDRDFTVFPTNTKITDSDSYSYNNAYGGGCDPELKMVKVAKGEKARGWVQFDVPEKATGLKLTYSPTLFSNVKQDVRFDLGR